ncbi:MAG TPA: SusE domain-containing protein [Mucilaginibacter sp.]|nr:SusE domain-containing protein [Mucilaginibacter sp.]
MKTLTFLTRCTLIGGITLLMVASCKKDEVKVIANTGKGGTLQASSTTIVLSKTNLADTAVTFNFSNANYGYKAAVTNVLQIDVPGDNFSNPKEYTLSAGSLKQSFTVPDFNTLLLALNLPTGTASQVQARIKSQISPNVAPVYSNVLSFTATPFALIAYLWVPGTYQGVKQWDPPTADSLVSPTGNGVYTGYVHFDAGGNFKITSNPDWNHTNYGDGGTGKISSSGGNLTAPGAGLYLVTVDVNAGTITYEAYDHLWSVIGDGALGWSDGDDVNMTFVPATNAYQVTTALKSSGAFKFRADHAWGLNLGGTAPLAPLVANGGNLSIPADGTYVVSLTFGNPLLGPTYTLVKQ